MEICRTQTASQRRFHVPVHLGNQELSTIQRKPLSPECPFSFVTVTTDDVILKEMKLSHLGTLTRHLTMWSSVSSLLFIHASNRCEDTIFSNGLRWSGGREMEREGGGVPSALLSSTIGQEVRTVT